MVFKMLQNYFPAFEEQDLFAQHVKEAEDERPW